MDVKGIYRIVNKINNKFYIGSASSNGGFRKRWNEHRCNLNKGTHHNKHLQSAWNKYGKDNFKFEVIEVIDKPEIILEREQHYLDTWNPDYNTCKIAGNTLGVKLTEKQKKLLSELAKLRTGDKNPFYGKTHSEETKKLMLKNKEGKPVKTKKPIYQLSIDGEIIKEWEGTYDAANSLNLPQSYINSVLNGKGKTCGGFKWVYCDLGIKISL